MDSEKVCLSSKTIEISETDTYLELTNRVCFYDEPNLNKVVLDSADALEKAQTLVNMPVVARYVEINGNPSFKGHEVYIDADGDVQFGTDNIGTHTEVYIQEDTVNVNGVFKTLPCLFAKYRVWIRNKNVVSAIKRLYSENKLYSSWEISTLAYEFKNGIKKLTDYTFLSNCLLGYESSFPAYGVDAKAISMSEKTPELLIAEAFTMDKLAESEGEELAKLNTEIATEEVVANENEKEVEAQAETEVKEEEKQETSVEEMKEEKEEEGEVSALTDNDIRMKLNQACREKLGRWCWVSYLFPNENVCWVEYEGRETETDYKLFSYTVNNDEVQISEPTDVKLSVGIPQVNNAFAELEDKINVLNNSLVEASSTIQSLNTQISELKVYKDKFEEAEQEKIAKELSEKQEVLKLYATKSGFISEEEIESSEEIKVMIENINEAGIKAIIAERFMRTLDENKPEVEVSTKVETKGKANIISVEDGVIDSKSAMKMFLKK